MSPRSPQADLAYRTVTIAGIVIAMVLVVMIFYFAASAFFTLFASLVLAAIFHGFTRLPRTVGVPRKASLVFILLLTLAIVAGLVLGSGAWLFSQAGELLAALRDQAESVVGMLQGWGLPVQQSDIAPSELGGLMPDNSGAISSASTAVFGVVGGLGNLFVIIFLAAFVAWEPGVYRRGLVSLFPKDKRARIDETIRGGANNLTMWLAGSALSMATVFVVSWIGLWAIGMPFAFLLALQAGILAFIPTLGAFVAGIPIILTGLSISGQMALLGLGVYVLIQGVESNVTTPIAQRFMTALPPALTLGVQLIFGVLFGLPGFILAVPIMAVLLVLIRNLYVEDVLGGPVEKDTDR